MCAREGQARLENAAGRCAIMKGREQELRVWRGEGGRGGERRREEKGRAGREKMGRKMRGERLMSREASS